MIELGVGLLDFVPTWNFESLKQDCLSQYKWLQLFVSVGHHLLYITVDSENLGSLQAYI